MRILLTGATGFIGRPLASALAARGDTVHALSRDPEQAARRLPDASRVFPWDGAQVPLEALEGVDAVLHLAGESVAERWTPHQKARILHSRVQGTRQIVDAMAEAGVATLVSTSAIGVYGDRGDEPLDESSTAGTGFLAEVCQAWEAEALRAADHGIRVARVRIGMVLGPGGGALEKLLLPFQLGVGGILGSGRQWMSWVHRDDVIGLFLHAADRREVSGVLNATAPHPVTNREFTATLAKTLGRPAFLPAPALALKLLLGEMAEEMLLAGQRVLPRQTEASGYRFAFPYLADALSDVLKR